ncbi:MAG: hypothetical protein AB1782_20635 [Cyanobacteriota bacterium]
MNITSINNAYIYTSKAINPICSYIDKPEKQKETAFKSSYDFLNPQLYHSNMVKISFSGLCSELKNVVDHCAYCGGKVYSEKEINKIVDDMIQLKGPELNKALNNLIRDLTQPDKKAESLIQDKNETINKKRVRVLEKLCRLNIAEPGLTCEALIKDNIKDLRLSPKKLESRGATEILKFMFYPMIESVDHFEPKIKGGENSRRNFVESCLGCNNLKSDMDPDNFLSRYPEVNYRIKRWEEEYKKKKCK